MKTLSVQSAGAYLDKMISKGVTRPIFLWGKPGIGKSSIVEYVASKNDMELIDLRISQLAPTDIRGVPYVNKETGVVKFARPDFYPTEGRGILFLDEMNMAAPIMMGICQQLVLDRRVGEHKIPDGWTIIAAGNRIEDRASVSVMPAPVANRFLHIDVEVNFEEWKAWALSTGRFPEQIISFLNFKPDQLMQPSKTQMTWPSPRSWDMAAELYSLDEEIVSAVGPGPDSEFRAFVKIYSKLPDIEAILAGNGTSINMPSDPSILYAMIGSFYSRAKDVNGLINATKWLLENNVKEDFFSVFIKDAGIIMEKNEWLGAYVKALKSYKSFNRILQFIKGALHG